MSRVWEYEETSNALVISIPIRSDFIGQLVLPKDISYSEVQRIAALLQTLGADLRVLFEKGAIEIEQLEHISPDEDSVGVQVWYDGNLILPTASGEIFANSLDAALRAAREAIGDDALDAALGKGEE